MLSWVNFSRLRSLLSQHEDWSSDPTHAHNTWPSGVSLAILATERWRQRSPGGSQLAKLAK